MSRTPASYSMPVVRGQTWEDWLDYIEEEDGSPIDLTGYQARMQIRALEHRYGTTTVATLVLELTTPEGNGLLTIETPPGGTVPNRVRITASASEYATLNPGNEKKVKYAYALEVYRPAAGGNPRYSLPLASGAIDANGWLIR